LRGLQAAIVDEFGLHLVDMKVCRETLQIATPDIANLAYSPADSYLVICEKHNPNLGGPHFNLLILSAHSGDTLAKWEWKKNPREAIKSVKFSKDEMYCVRLVPQTTQN
jgi:uncharacterized protein with WD repeat